MRILRTFSQFWNKIIRLRMLETELDDIMIFFMYWTTFRLGRILALGGNQ